MTDAPPRAAARAARAARLRGRATITRRRGRAPRTAAACAAAGVRAHAGIWPGASAFMALAAAARVAGSTVSSRRRDRRRAPPTAGRRRRGRRRRGRRRGACERLALSFFTSGTGGAGATIVAATFLLLVEACRCRAAGADVRADPWSSDALVDFGAPTSPAGRGVRLGERRVYLLDNPDVPTLAAALGPRLTDAASRFGTAPGVWNLLFAASKAEPARGAARRRAGDGRARGVLGAGRRARPTRSWRRRRCASTRSGARRRRRRRAAAARELVAHAELEDCVELATAAFAIELLRDEADGGVAPAGPAEPRARSARVRRCATGVRARRAPRSSGRSRRAFADGMPAPGRPPEGARSVGPDRGDSPRAPGKQPPYEKPTRARARLLRWSRAALRPPRNRAAASRRATRQSRASRGLSR